MVRCESRSGTIGHITLDTKQTGAPSAGNPHAGCDVAGAGNGFTVWLLRHSQRKRGATARLDLRNTAPVLAPTERFLRLRRSSGWITGKPANRPTGSYCSSIDELITDGCRQYIQNSEFGCSPSQILEYQRVILQVACLSSYSSYTVWNGIRQVSILLITLICGHGTGVESPMT